MSNLALSSRHAVHANRYNGPACYNFGAPHGSEAYRPTTRAVTCRKCIKIEAEAAAHADRIAYLADVADTQDMDLSQAQPEAADLDALHAEAIAMDAESAELFELAMVAADALVTRVTGTNATRRPSLGGQDEARDEEGKTVWLDLSQNKPLWRARGVQGTYTSKARATAAYRAATRIRNTIGLRF